MTTLNGQSQSRLDHGASRVFAYEQVIDEICDLNWINLGQAAPRLTVSLAKMDCVPQTVVAPQ